MDSGEFWSLHHLNAGRVNMGHDKFVRTSIEIVFTMFKLIYSSIVPLTITYINTINLMYSLILDVLLIE